MFDIDEQDEVTTRFITAKVVRARKSRICDYCFGIITPRRCYDRRVYLVDGEIRVEAWGCRGEGCEDVPQFNPFPLNGCDAG